MDSPTPKNIPKLKLDKIGEPGSKKQFKLHP
jgi:hypothetical protein